MSGLVGQVINDTYHFSEYIGRGGMAEVYKVWDAQRVIYLAAKVLHKDMALDKVFLRRFKREADTLTKLQHPHIIRSYGLQQEGRLAFLLMDFVEGESLKELIFDSEGPLPTEQIRNILRPVTGALHYAHSQGFVHCDIKPANIMLDKYGEVRLADFGIARVTDAATATMIGAGTPAYMAPEQVKGLDPTPQTDIYALGIVLFEMLTGGERPFTGETASMTGSTGEKIRREQLTVKPPSIRKFNSNISPALDALVRKCLAKNPAKRYQNPLDLLNDFERALDGTAQPTISKPTPAPQSQLVAPPPAQKTVPLPPPVSQAKPSAPQLVYKSPVLQAKKKFPVWGYVAGWIVLLGVLLFASLGSKRGAKPAYLPISTKTPVPTATIKSTKTVQPALATSRAIRTATALFAPMATQTAQTLADSVDGPKDWNLFFDDFDQAAKYWETGDVDSDFWNGIQTINGTYVWNMKGIKKEGFISYEEVEGVGNSDIYYIQVDARLSSGSKDLSCYGIIFGYQSDGYFTYEICDDQTYEIEYLSQENGWDEITDWEDATSIKTDEWNTLAINVNRQHATFYVNGTLIEEIDHLKLSGGESGVLVGKYDDEPAKFEFDNFILRWPSEEQIEEIETATFELPTLAPTFPSPPYYAYTDNDECIYVITSESENKATGECVQRIPAGTRIEVLKDWGNHFYIGVFIGNKRLEGHIYDTSVTPIE